MTTNNVLELPLCSYNLCTIFLRNAYLDLHNVMKTTQIFIQIYCTVTKKK